MKEEEIIDYIKENEATFQSILLSEAGDVASKIHSILEEGDIDLLKNAERIAFYVITGEQKEIVAFAAVEGKAWAKHSLTLALKLEWIHALRRTLWIILRKHIPIEHASHSTIDFFALEKKINDGIDEFLNSFSLVIRNIKMNSYLNKGN